jgi:exodeoxyribonuclease VII small subunit
VEYNENSSEFRVLACIFFEGGNVAEQKFEDALQKLEAIVKKLEDGKLNLEESLKAFEEGMRLSRFCSKKLDEAEKKVEVLLKDGSGRLVTKPFSLEEEKEEE